MVEDGEAVPGDGKDDGEAVVEWETDVERIVEGELVEKGPRLVIEQRRPDSELGSRNSRKSFLTRSKREKLDVCILSVEEAVPDAIAEAVKRWEGKVEICFEQSVEEKDERVSDCVESSKSDKIEKKFEI
ncbi:hypothetical protein CCACVL1_08748 [Corchorus capsularis]|uniref:Uncharacterized protein n=1 Tax=Corchorus capsularis TaxID=210143 RepID=A0A1R3IZ10_COCAP|nr:hypothetical protein CCACVL1_08748 [Corchorus capsularis]